MAKRRTINMVKSQVIYKDYSKDAERTALISGENLSHMFGKIARWYTDISWVGHKHVVADITDFPTLGTAASKDVPVSGDAGNDEVVMGNDSRLTDARTPTSHTHSVSEITDFPTLGTAAEYNVSSSGDASNNEVVLGNDSRLTDARTPLSHTHTEADITNLGTYAEGATKGGAATSANKLNIGNSDIGNSTTPVYFDSETGLPIALSYTIEKSVPADAVFTDTTYSTMGPSGSSHAGGLVPDTPSTAGTSKYLREDGTWAIPPNSEYVHPSYTPYSSGLYKITVDTLGHVSAASAVTGADLPSHSHTVSDITNFPTLGTAAGYDVPASGDADDDEVVLGNDSRLTDARTPLSHTHTEADISDLGTYAGSSTKGGAATSANKLNIGSSDIGSETKPVYFNATTGKPVACAYSLNASVPANAVFTDINVKQSPSTANESREVLFAGNTGNTETVGTTGKSNKLYFNPSTGALTATSFSGSVDASNLTGSIDAARLPNSGVTANSYGPAAGGTLTYGGTFDVPYVTVDKYGRLTAASTKTFTMPAQYTHPSYTSKTSGLYKITVDSLGHVSATAAVTASDLPSHSHTLNMASSTGSSSITLAANTKYQLTAGGSTYIFTTPTDTVYTHPTYTEKANGLYKITVDSLGHVSATAAVTASDLPSHTHPYLPDTTKYAGSSSVGGAATSANKLNIGSSSIGNSTTPVYFDSTTGLPVALSYTIEKSVPADAKFTDTIYTHPSYTAKASGLYKITVDSLGHVSAASAVTGTDLPSHSHNLSIASSTGTSQISLSANTKYQLTAGGSTYIFTTPADNNTTYSVTSGDNNGQIKITPSSGNAYNVSVKGLGSAAYTNSSAYATSGHTHTLNIAASSGTSQISLSPNTKYQLTAGGSTYIFTTPPATTMTYSISTGDNNGQIKVTPSSGDAYNVSVKGLGSAAYTNSSAYAAASHTHTYLTDPGDSTYTIEVAWKGASVPASETSYPAVYTPYNKSAGVTYRIKEMSWADFRTSLGLGSAAYTNSSAYAAASHTHSSITGIQKHDAAVPTSTVGTGIFTMFYNVDNPTGNMPKVNNANAILQFNRHDGEYDSQLGFSSDGNIYYRYALGSALTTSSPWKQLAWKDDRMGANSDGSYWGMTTPNNESDAWIRTTSYGIIPYQSGGAGSGHSSLGTSAWYFDSAYIDSIYGTLYGRAVYADNSYVLVTDPSSKGIYGIVFVADPSITEDNTLRKSNSIRMNHFVGAADTEGITELILGNAVAKSSAGNSSGHLTLYNANGKWAEIYPNASATSDYNLYLPASTGTLALVGDNNHTHNYAGSSSPGGAASSANKLNTNAGSNVSPVYFSGGKPVACNVCGSSGGYFNNVARIESDGVMEIGAYIDMHATNGSTNDYDYRITNTSTSNIDFSSRSGNNTVKLFSPSGYNQIRFHTGESGKAYNASGITVYPLTTSGSCMMIESGGNMIIGAGESPSSIYSNDYLGAQTSESEYIYVSADEGVILISGADTFANKSAAIFDSSGAFRPVAAGTLSVGRSDCYWNKAYITQTTGGKGGGWISARDNATVKSICVPASSSYCPVVSVKTNNGEWSIGSLGSTSKNTENLYFSYTTDTNYSAGSNTASTYYISTSGWFNGTAAKADKWTSAKTLTIGSTGKSVDGSGNVSWSLSEIGAAAASHDHNLITRNATITYGASRLQWFDLSGTGTVSASTVYNPSNDWYHHIMLNHGNGNGYYVDLAICFHQDLFYYKRISSGTIANANRNNGWVRIIDSSCIGDQTVAAANTANKWATARTLTLTGSVTGSVSIDGSGNVSLATTTNHTHSYLPLSGGTMTGNITFTGVTSTSYPALSNQLYWSGSTDWAKIYYRVDASDAGRLVLDIGDDANTRIDFAYNGTTKSYIDTNGNFSGTSNITNYINIVAGNEIRFNVGSKPSSVIDLYIGYAWSDGTKDAKIQRYKFENGSGTLTIVEASSFEATSSIRLGTSSNQGTITLYNNNNKSFSIVASPDATAGGGITLPPTSGLMTGIVYKATDSYLGTIKANGYWGMATPSGATNDWIRTTSLGIIPYQSGGAGSGHQSIGTSSWYFSQAYIDHVYGTVDTSENVYCYDFGDSSYTSWSSYGIIFAADPNISEINSLRKRNDIRMNYMVGAAGSEGILELILGNALASSVANNCSGHLTLYNSNGKWCEIRPSVYATSDYYLDLPGDNGTLALIGKSPYFGCMFAGLMEGTISSHTSLAQNNQSWCGTYQVNGTWYNMISVRHRNGAADGNSYGFYIRNSLTGASNLVYNQQYSGNWRGELTILDSSCYSSYALPLSGGTMTGNLTLTESKSILLRPNHSSYTSGIGYDTSGNECIGIWAKNTVTRLRWHAGVDMTTMSAGTMMGITYPDFEISKASGTPLGYIGGRQIVRSQLLFSGSTTITSGKEKTTITLTDTVSPFGFVAIRFYYSGNPAGYCETIVSSYNNNWMSGVFAVNPGGGAPGTYNACKTLGVYVNNSAQMTFNCDANLIIYNITGYCEG